MENPRLETEAARYAWVAAMARASGDEELARDYEDRMMRAWALLNPEAIEVVYDDELHGASGSW